MKNYKINIRTLTVLLLVGMCAIAPGIARAQEVLSIAVVDVEKLLRDSSAAISIKKQLDGEKKKFQSELEALEVKLRDEAKGLEEKSKDLSKEDLAKKVQAFQQKQFDARKTFQAKKVALDKGYSHAMNTLSKAIFDATQKVAEEKKYSLVITKNNVIVGSKSLDVTTNVMESLNKALPDVKLDIQDNPPTEKK